MKKLLIGLTLLFSMSVLARDNIRPVSTLQKLDTHCSKSNLASDICIHKKHTNNEIASFTITDNITGESQSYVVIKSERQGNLFSSDIKLTGSMLKSSEQFGSQYGNGLSLKSVYVYLEFKSKTLKTIRIPRKDSFIVLDTEVYPLEELSQQPSN